MFSPEIDVIILAAIALFVLSQLYMALGRNSGEPKSMEKAPLQRREAEAPQPKVVENPNLERPLFSGPAASELEQIYDADSSFSPDEFLKGAKSAYQMLVDAFAKGDREALRPLLDDDVYEAWNAEIDRREAAGEAPFSLLRIRSAAIEAASMTGTMARVMVRYASELGDGESTRTAREIWTFMRDIESKSPNWLLDDVEIAS